MSIKQSSKFFSDPSRNFASSAGKKAFRTRSFSAVRVSKNGLNSVNGLYSLETERKHYQKWFQGFLIDENSNGEGIGECLTPEKVLKENPFLLTDYEKKEILDYSEIYYIGHSTKKHNGKFCDEKGYYRAFIGDHISYRYEISHLLGDGSFGIVASCFDHKTQTPVAIKILRKGKSFEEIGELEVKALDSIQHNGPNDAIIEKFDEFLFRGHYCIVFELLSTDLFSYLKRHNFQGMNINVLKRIAIQLLIGLKHIHKSRLIHCDLKPENILFKAKNKSSIKIIDFGSSCEQSNKLFTYIQSRYYRAPEVILEIDYSEKIDIWSLGCILFEMYTGIPLFASIDEHEQLCKISDIISEIPHKMVKNSHRHDDFFDNKGRILRKNEDNFDTNKKLSNMLKSSDPGFVDFLSKCLNIDPKCRVDAEQALLHPWIKGKKLKNSRSLRVFNTN
ncbi:hypothetical protein SteCoe_32583 [Stentor coeruleus]|uniref:dual-specificity kinase n=1 Tax=Stentor coeruleus TaxID=5963 RepID=A0A1R2AYM7_9CILI|nr:hypothetical protein SteCoe_32583 [Stentor coeruleus]